MAPYDSYLSSESNKQQVQTTIMANWLECSPAKLVDRFDVQLGYGDFKKWYSLLFLLKAQHSSVAQRIKKQSVDYTLVKVNSIRKV